jgi:hypothetical protein
MKTTLAACIAAITLDFAVSAAPVFHKVQGANPAAIQATVDQFRAALGGSNNGVGGSFTTGRREINWDDVPDNLASPNNFPRDFYNVNSPRGLLIESVSGNFIRVSARAASGNPVRFGELDASYPTNFQTFSGERLFQGVNNPGDPIIDITFVIPGTNIPATVSGFGVVFTDVDLGITGAEARLTLFGPSGAQLTNSIALTSGNAGLSFLGITFNAGERVARVRIECVNRFLQSGAVDTATVDVAAMDDFIYGEPRALDFHPGDADGDGIADARVYRPNIGTWFTLNSGSGTVSIEQFGIAGDIPIDGDFDGDSRADTAVYRPSEGGWYVRRSSNNTFITVAFGTATDKPVAGDYDKDGKTDIAVWRPSNGNYFVLRSSNNQTSFFAFPFGQNGDIPVGAAAIP